MLTEKGGYQPQHCRTLEGTPASEKFPLLLTYKQCDVGKGIQRKSMLMHIMGYGVVGAPLPVEHGTKYQTISIRVGNAKIIGTCQEECK